MMLTIAAGVALGILFVLLLPLLFIAWVIAWAWVEDHPLVNFALICGVFFVLLRLRALT